MTAPLLRERLLTFDDLTPGITLKGRVTNIASFGVFVDIGVGRHGLLHSSVLDKGLPSDAILLPGQTLTVTVADIDRRRGRITLHPVKEETKAA